MSVDIYIFRSNKISTTFFEDIQFSKDGIVDEYREVKKEIKPFSLDVEDFKNGMDLLRKYYSFEEEDERLKSNIFFVELTIKGYEIHFQKDDFFDETLLFSENRKNDETLHSSENRKNDETLHSSQNRRVITTHEELLQRITESNSYQKRIIFVDCMRNKKEENIVSFLKKNDLNFYGVEVDYSFYSKDEKVEFLKIAEGILSPSPIFVRRFNPYKSLSFSPEDYSLDECNEYFSFLEEITVIIVEYISLGFLSREFTLIDENSFEGKWWCFNLQRFALKSFLKFFNLLPPYQDRVDIPIEEFAINKEYRFEVTEYLCKFISNIIVNSRFPIQLPGKIIKNKLKVTNWGEIAFYQKAVSYFRKFISIEKRE